MSSCVEREGFGYSTQVIQGYIGWEHVSPGASSMEAGQYLPPSECPVPQTIPSIICGEVA